jgi:hypothetical protein
LSTLRFITRTRCIRFLLYSTPGISAPTRGAREYRQRPFGDVAAGLMFDKGTSQDYSASSATRPLP